MEDTDLCGLEKSERLKIPSFLELLTAAVASLLMSLLLTAFMRV